MKRICVFCGSNVGNNAAYVSAAQELGRLLVSRGIGLVYGGASVGIMGAVANSMLAEGGEVIGVIPTFLNKKEVGHTALTELHIVESMHQRKALMAELSDGFIALPGGVGTMEEFFEVWTWAQLGLHGKPCALLNVADYYQHLITFINNLVDTGFLKSEQRDIVLVSDDIRDLLTRMENYQAPKVEKWLLSDET